MMKNRRKEIIFISLLNIILTIIFACYCQKIVGIFSIEPSGKIWLITIILYIISLFIFDLIVIALILLIQNKYIRVIAYNIIYTITTFLGMYFYIIKKNIIPSIILLIFLIIFLSAGYKLLSPSEDQIEERAEKKEEKQNSLTESKEIKEEYILHDIVNEKKETEEKERKAMERLAKAKFERDKTANGKLYVSSVQLYNFLKETSTNEQEIYTSKISSWLFENKYILLKRNVKLYNKAANLTCEINEENLNAFINDLCILTKQLNNETTSFRTEVNTGVNEQKKKFQTNELIDNYCVIDIETTGLSRQNDHIIEISALRVRNNEITDTFSQLVKPTIPIPAAATNVNGITNEMVKNTPGIKEVISNFVAFVGDDIVIGHNIGNFDLEFIARDCQNELGKQFTNDYIDTYPLAKKIFTNMYNYKLPTLCRELGIAKPQHRAEADCISTKELYDKIKQTLNK